MDRVQSNDDGKWGRFAILTGLAFSFLSIVGAAIASDEPMFLAKADTLQQHYVENGDQVLASNVMYMLGVFFLLWFIATLAAHLRRHEAGDWVSRAAQAGGVAGATLMLGGAAINAAGALSTEERNGIDPVAAMLLHDISSVMFGLAAPMAIAVLVLACTLLAFTSDALPKWLGFVSLLLGVALLIPMINWAAMIGFVFWVAVVSIVLFLRHGRSRERTAATVETA